MALIIRGVKLLKQICELNYTLTVPEGTFLAILGNRRSGRSALLHLIAGFEFPTSGNISFNNAPIQNLAPGDRPFTIVFQDGNLFNHLTVFENVALGLKGTLQLNRFERETVKKIISYVGLEDSLPKKPNDISPLQQQKAAIARSILGRKPLLLLDEPFKVLESAEREQMCLLLKNIHEKFQLTTLMVVSDCEEAACVSSAVAIVHEGTIVHVGSTKETLQNPEFQKFAPLTGQKDAEMRWAC